MNLFVGSCLECKHQRIKFTPSLFTFTVFIWWYLLISREYESAPGSGCRSRQDYVIDKQFSIQQIYLSPHGSGCNPGKVYMGDKQFSIQQASLLHNTTVVQEKNKGQYYLASVLFNRLIDLVGKVFPNGPGDRGSIPGRVILNT